MKKSNVDLTQGVIWKQLVIFSLPILLGHLFQNLYSSVDSLVVGNFVGKGALAAVNVSIPITNLLVGFFTGMSTGASVVFSKSLGTKNYQKLSDSIHTTLYFSILLGLIMGIAGIMMSDTLLRVVDCPADIFEEADIYLSIFIAGIIFTSLYNVGAGILRAIGDSQSPFNALVASGITNVVLDILFVAVFKMGVMGVGFATVIAQVVSVFIVFEKLLKMDERYRFDWKKLKIDKQLLIEVVNYGLPAGMQTCLISFSNMFVNRYVNAFGSSAMAGVGVGMRLDKFAGLPCQSIGLAMTTFVSMNIGAKKYDRISQGMVTGFILCLISITVIGIPLYFGSEILVSAFNQDPDVIYYGVNMMHTIIPLYFTMAINQVFAGSLRGFGKAKPVMFLSLIGMVFVRQAYLHIAMSINPAIDHVYYGYPLAWAISGLTLMIYYFYLKKNHHLYESI